VAVVLAALPGSAIAKPGYFVSGHGRRAVLHVAGSNGYRVKLEANAARHHRAGQIYVTASKRPASVQYTVRGSLASDDSIDVRLPHVGRIAVRFVPRHVTRGRVPDNCKGSPSRIEHGYFRGSISLRGEREFTIVDRTSAPGRIVRSYRTVCDNQGFWEPANSKGPKLSTKLLFIGDEKISNPVGFTAIETEFGPKLIGPRFSANVTRFREAMLVRTSVEAEGDRGDFTAPEPDAPKVAEVEPPAPFEGTATFRKTGPRTSTWDGDLAVEMPGLGKVALAGPAFWSVYCQDTHCTNTAPPNVSIVSVSG